MSVVPVADVTGQGDPPIDTLGFDKNPDPVIVTDVLPATTEEAGVNAEIVGLVANGLIGRPFSPHEPRDKRISAVEKPLMLPLIGNTTKRRNNFFLVVLLSTVIRCSSILIPFRH